MMFCSPHRTTVHLYQQSPGSYDPLPRFLPGSREKAPPEKCSSHYKAYNVLLYLVLCSQVPLSSYLHSNPQISGLVHFRFLLPTLFSPVLSVTLRLREDGPSRNPAASPSR